MSEARTIDVPHSLDDLVVLKLWAVAATSEQQLAAELADMGLSVAAFRLIREVMMSPDGVRQGEIAQRLVVGTTRFICFLNPDGTVLELVEMGAVMGLLHGPSKASKGDG